jgi:Thiol-disulfide isomerase and thioredoxins
MATQLDGFFVQPLIGMRIMQKLNRPIINVVFIMIVLLFSHTIIMGQSASAVQSLQLSENTKVKSVKELVIRGQNRKSDIVVTGKLLKSGNDQLVIAEDSVIHVFNVVKDSLHSLFSVRFDDAVQQMIISDIDNNGQNEIIAATGKSGYADDIDINLFIIKRNSETWQPFNIYTKASERPYPTFLQIAEDKVNDRKEIILSYFASKYIVETVAISMDGTGNWQNKVVEKKRMATSRDIGVLPGNANPVAVVGRPYGDTVGMTGDAYIKLIDGEKPLPAFRGVKVVRIGDLNGDGKNEIFIGDGWHQDYGKIARGRLAMINSTDTGYQYELIEDVKGQPEISQIVIADITGDGKNELVTRGNKYFRVYTKDRGAWKVFTDDQIISAPFAIGDINGDGYPDVIFAGKDKISVYNFNHLSYSADLGKEIVTEKIDPASLLDKKAPGLVAEKWYNGSFAGMENMKGKVVVLDFWATWCKPCIKMFPTLRSWQQKYGKDGLVILGLTKIDNAQDLLAIDNFIGKEKFPYPIGVAEEAFNNLSYGVGGIPHMVLIDKEGMVRRFEVGAGDGKDFENEIKKYLAK